MALDFLAFKRLLGLISKEVSHGKICKIQQISNEEFVFTIRNNNYNYLLIINTHPNMPYVNLIKDKPSSDILFTKFSTLLKKHLENGKILAINQLNDDRVVCFTILNRDDYYNDAIKKLYIELIGRAANIILTDENNKIIDALKKIPLEYNNLRTIQSNINYTLPAKPSNVLPTMVLNEINYLHISEKELEEKISKSDYIYITSNEKKKDFHFFPFLHLNGKIDKYIWNEGLSIYYKNIIDNERHRQYSKDVEKVIKSHIKKLLKKIDKLKQEIFDAKKAVVYKDYGNLLLTYGQNLLINKKDNITIFDEVNEIEITIPVDRKLSIYHNANLYFKKYQKSKTALIKINEQLQIAQEEFDYFSNLQFQVENGSYKIILQIQEELEELGYLKSKVQKNNKKNKKEKIYQPIQIQTDNTLISVGQNNLQNEYLTFKLANKNHYFFHVAQGAGAHVIVHSDILSEKLIRKAANLAALNSLFKDSSSVEIYYTKVRNVKKIPGGKPGKVIISNHSSIFIDPSDDMIN